MTTTTIPLPLEDEILEDEIKEVEIMEDEPEEERSTLRVTIPRPLRFKTAPSVTGQFPPALFNRPQVAVEALKHLNLPVEETTYLAIGGGLGSFAWVNHLVIYGVPPQNIVSIGFEAEPHGRYRRLCRHSQIPDEERLRSDSGSTPDNIWGWPGYAVREIGHDLRRGRLGHAAKIAWQIFTEPVLAEPYTPKAGNVYASIEREARRIGWPRMWRYGKVRAIRQTDDGRYAVAYSQSTATERIHKIMIADTLHLAVGYAGFRFLPDLQDYRARSGDVKQVVNAYEQHDHVYEQLRERGGTVLIRGRGIVASRVIQRLYEERQHNPRLAIIHLMRTPRPDGACYQKSCRPAENHFELQPYNFPKASFGGGLREKLATMDESERPDYIGLWGGTTTANRRDWREIIAQGTREGWYQPRFGQVEQVARTDEGEILTIIQGQTIAAEQTRLRADFIIDATGLDADLENNPLLRDLLKTYDLERNAINRLRVSPAFELTGLRNGSGRVYAAGAMTLGGPYAPVDSFVGLQYAAQQSVNELVRLKAAGVRRMTSLRVVDQWLRWAGGVTA